MKTLPIFKTNPYAKRIQVLGVGNGLNVISYNTHIFKDSSGDIRVVRCKLDKKSPCKLCELAKNLWKSDDSDINRVGSRYLRRPMLATIIKVINDPENVDNNGGLCFFSIGRTLRRLFDGDTLKQIDNTKLSTSGLLKMKKEKKKKLKDIYEKHKIITLQLSVTNGYKNWTDGGCYIMNDVPGPEITDKEYKALKISNYLKTFKYLTIKEEDCEIVNILEENGIKFTAKHTVEGAYVSR